MSSMEKICIPAGYAPSLSLYETQKAIVVVKRVFQDTNGITFIVYDK